MMIVDIALLTADDDGCNEVRDLNYFRFLN